MNAPRFLLVLVLTGASGFVPWGNPTSFLLAHSLENAPHIGPEADAGSAEILYLNNRGVALLDQYKFQEAIEQFRQIIQIDESIIPAHVNLGIAYFYGQKYEEALASLKKAQELDPNQIHSHYVMGLIYRNQDQVDEAIQAFEAVNRQDPRDPSTNYYLGRLSMRLRDYDAAVNYFKRVIEEEPYNASAHYNLATALGRSGKKAEGLAEMQEFRRLQNLFGSTTVGLQYLEQGIYAIAIDRIPAPYVSGADKTKIEGPKVMFTEVASQSGLRFSHAGPGRLDPVLESLDSFENSVVPYLGSGIAFTDYDGDGDMDLFLANAGSGRAHGRLFRNKGDGSFEDRTENSGLNYAGSTMHALWGDYDNDSFPDLYLVNYGPNVLYHNNGDGTFSDVTATTKTGDDRWGMGGGFVDFDHDGDLDIFVANFLEIPQSIEMGARFPEDLTGADNVLYRNNGDRSFTDVSKAAAVDGKGLMTTSFISSDLDNTRDVDFYLVNHAAPNQLLNNLRDGSFRLIESASLTMSESGVGVGLGDLNSDGLMDLALPSLGSNPNTLLINQGHNRYELSEAISSFASGSILNAQFFDYDNDGDLDLLLISAPLLEARPVLTRERNLYLLKKTEPGFQDVSEETGLDRFVNLAVRGLSIADYDNDGDLDFSLSVNGGAPLLLRNDGGNQNNWIAVRVVGTNSNRTGLGVKAEVKAGDHWQRLESLGGQGFLTQNSPVLHFGLGRRERADVVRLLWPNGVLQSELDRPANQVFEVHELDRKGTSCPILYVWNGDNYQFQTDFLGGSAYGSLLAPGQYNYPDTDEYVKLNRSDVSLRDGRVSISMNNQLEEVIMFDQLELVVVDHPADYEIYPDEKLLPGPPYLGFRLLSESAGRRPVAARDDRGNDILSVVAEIDRLYPELPPLLPFKGYTRLHHLELDLGEVSEDYVVLLMHAWIDYADSTSNLAAWQAGVQLVPPYLQVQDESGEWVTVIERMGFPAGLPKVMTVDLSGKFLSRSRKVRIVTNMRIFWDQILVESGAPRSDYQLYRLSAESAELRFRGFPKFESPDGRLPKIYSYKENMAAEWKVHLGAYTRFGDVLPLLEKRDDMFVITRSGDEIEARFDVQNLPATPEGWVRDYLVFVDGFGKDMDPNSASPTFLGPLPFHGMTSYPYTGGDSYPQTPEYQEYLRHWNTRIYETGLPELSPDRPVD